MKRIIGIILGATALLGCNNKPAVDPAPSIAACPANITNVGSSSYSVTECKLKIGQTVTITANETHPLLVDGRVKSETTEAIGFATVGTFNFKCERHSSMTGKIIVEQ
jgi:plastocyanin